MPDYQTVWSLFSGSWIGLLGSALDWQIRLQISEDTEMCTRTQQPRGRLRTLKPGDAATSLQLENLVSSYRSSNICQDGMDRSARNYMQNSFLDCPEVIDFSDEGFLGTFQ